MSGDNSYAIEDRGGSFTLYDTNGAGMRHDYWSPKGSYGSLESAKQASRTVQNPSRVMTHQEAHDTLVREGYKPVPGSSRYEDYHGTTARIQPAPGRGDTFYIEMEGESDYEPIPDWEGYEENPGWGPHSSVEEYARETSLENAIDAAQTDIAIGIISRDRGETPERYIERVPRLKHLSDWLKRQGAQVIVKENPSEPMTPEQIRRIEQAERETQRLLDREMSYSPDLRKQEVIAGYKKHLAYLADLKSGKAEVKIWKENPTAPMGSEDFAQYIKDHANTGVGTLRISTLSKLGGERYDSATITFYNVPEDIGRGGGGAVASNNRLLMFVDGFGKGFNEPPPTGKVKFRLGAGEVFYGSDREHVKRPRGKTASPQKVAEYVVKIINEVSQLPPKLPMGQRMNPYGSFAQRLPGMTAKGQRMEEDIAAQGSAYAPSAVVYAAAKRQPGTGLVTKKWAKSHGYPKPNPSGPQKILVKEHRQPDRVLVGIYGDDREWYTTGGDAIEVGGAYVDQILEPARHNPRENPMRLTDRDKKVIKAFAAGRADSSKKLTSEKVPTGHTLHGNWMGGSYIANRYTDGTVDLRRDHGSKAIETVHRAIKKVVAPYDLRENPALTPIRSSPHPALPYVLVWTITIDNPHLRSPGQVKPEPGTVQVWEKRFPDQKTAVSYYEGLLGGEEDFSSEYVRDVALYNDKGTGNLSTARTVRKKVRRAGRDKPFFAGREWRENPSLESFTIDGVEKALWIPAWHDYQIETGGEYASYDGNIADVAPEPPEETRSQAKALIAKMTQGGNLIGPLMDAARADSIAGDDLNEEYAEDFGYYITMSTLGHGVGWEDDHAPFESRYLKDGVYAEAHYDGEDLYVSM
jgi:hypothetical protein